MTEKMKSRDTKFEEACIAGKISSEKVKEIAGIADPEKREAAIKELLK